MTTVAARASGEKRAKVEEREEKKAFLDRKRPEKVGRTGDLLARALTPFKRARERGSQEIREERKARS